MMAKASRRRFVGDIAKTVCGVSLMGMGLGLYARKSGALRTTALRPPGALPENEFLGACVRCGLCVRDCPYDTLQLANMNEGAAVGTPIFSAREVPCEMCEDIPCIEACPSGALDKSITNIDDARMGLAVLLDQENCLNFQGLRCDVCYRVCPLIDDAITLKLQHNQRSGVHAMFLPTVHSDRCTGCGKCEYACVLEESAIKVLPLALAKGKAGSHYRLGWEEKEQAGESLVTPEPQHRYNMPEGTRYEFDKGLIPGQRQEQPR